MSKKKQEIRKMALWSVWARLLWLWVVVAGLASCERAPTGNCGACTVGEKRCKSDQTAVLICRILPSTGCETFVSDNCPRGQICSTAQGEATCNLPAACTNPCSSGRKRCNQGSVETCQIDALGCLGWTQTQRCQADESCKSDDPQCVKGGCTVTNAQEEKRCVGDDLYWFDNCGNQAALIESCQAPQVCQADGCKLGGCSVTQPQEEKRCVGSDLYWFDNCGNQAALIESCQAPKQCFQGACIDPACQATNPQAERRCVGNEAFWFDDCGFQVSRIESCNAPKICKQGACEEPPCQITNAQAERRCVGNESFWFDNCGNQAARIEACRADQQCQQGLCQDIGCQPTNPQAERRCVGNSVHWFDNCGNQGAMIEACNPPASCQNAQCFDPCAAVNQCNLNTDRCVSNTTIQSCVPNAQGCAVWGNVRDCGTNMICQNNACIIDPATLRQCRVSDNVGGSCSGDSECCQGQRCVNKGLFRHCETCTRDADCPRVSGFLPLICCKPPNSNIGYCTGLLTCTEPSP